MDGWIKLHRKIIESAIWDKPPLYLKVWMFLLVSAQHSPYKGLLRGQMSLSIPDIIEGCKWRVGARTERPTKDQVYQIIDWLRKPNEGGHEGNAKATMITTTKATHGMLIEVVNYAVYQDSEEDESNDESNGETDTKPTRKQRQPNNINKNVKNEKNEQELIDSKASSRQNAKRVYTEADRVYKLAKRFHELAYENAVEIGTSHLIKEPDFQKWSDTFRLILERDKIPEVELGEVIKYALQENFYRTIIFSPKNLREHYPRILTQMRSQLRKPRFNAAGGKAQIEIVQDTGEPGATPEEMEKYLQKARDIKAQKEREREGGIRR
ncbi:hypothetical protein [Paenibacillus graminis]|uniref:hypothetical protein n=1 Tax=Paenibacillus graminis TaxID=189425 RepID=UPI002DC05CEB|nr:hypothetical protein [Paenibacillus graminis]MEC0173025.1 hypothetical protein [Paenibacillus graminis]